MIEREDYQLRAIVDNYVELVIFTPKGAFGADPDFGFEYWNHEFSNIHYRDFNNGQTSLADEVSRFECQEGIRESLSTYLPVLKNIDVLIEISSLASRRGSKSKSKYEVLIKVTGSLDDGLGTYQPYEKTVSFLMEPSVKKYNY